MAGGWARRRSGGGGGARYLAWRVGPCGPAAVPRRSAGGMRERRGEAAVTAAAAT